MIESKHQIIIKRINTFPRGEIFFPDSFDDIGNADSVRQSLSRICRDGLIIRLAKGIYLFPQIDGDLGVLYPSVKSIARAIAQRDRSRIIPTGLFALNQLGLSTQVPMKVVFLSDGMPRTIKIGNQTIVFKHTNPKSLSMKGDITTLATAALKEIGKANVTAEQVAVIHKILSQESPDIVLHDARLAPEWISKILLNR